MQILQAYGKINKVVVEKKRMGYIPDHVLLNHLHKTWGFQPNDEKIKCFWRLFYELEKYNLSSYLTFVLPHLVGDPLGFCQLHKNKSVEYIIALILKANA